MKRIIDYFAPALVLFFTSCGFANKNEQDAMKTIYTVEEAIAIIKSYSGNVADFQLNISSEITWQGLETPYSVSMALITDVVLKKGWLPNGVTEPKAGIKSYSHKAMNQN